MRVLQLGYSYHYNAQGAITKSIKRELTSNKIESAIVFYEEGSKAELHDKQCNPLILSLVTRLLNKIFGRKPVHSIIQTLIAIAYIKKYKPDVAHIHIIHHGCYDYKRLLSYLSQAGIPVVFTMHDMWFMTGGCYHFSDIGCKKFQSECSNCPGKNNMDCKKEDTHKCFVLKQNLIKKIDAHFVAVSTWVEKEARQSALRDREITTICNGIDISIFHPQVNDNKNCAKKNFNIISVANSWSKDKGIFDIFSIAHQCGSEFTFTLVGECPEEFQRQAPNNVRFAGRIDNKQKLAESYCSSDIFIHLSICETFGMVIAEAACCGLPVVGYKSTGIEEVISRVGGTMVEIGDINGFVKILNSFKNCGAINQRDPKFFIESFSIDTMAKKYVELYREIWKDGK